MVKKLEEGVGVLDESRGRFLLRLVLAHGAPGQTDGAAVGGGVRADGVGEGVEREVVRLAAVLIGSVEILEPVEGVGYAAISVDWLGRVFVVAGAEGL